MFHSSSSSRTVSAFLFWGGNSCPHTNTHPKIIDPEGFRQVLFSAGSSRKEELGVHSCRDICLHSLQCMSTMRLRTGKQVEFCTNKGTARQKLEINMVGESLPHFPLTDLLVCACLKCSLLQMDRME